MPTDGLYNPHVLLEICTSTRRVPVPIQTSTSKVLLLVTGNHREGPTLDPCFPSRRRHHSESFGSDDGEQQPFQPGALWPSREL
jgi:hypothetical protein